MYSLDVIHSMNARASKPVEAETTRHCSFVKSATGIVLHSAKHRNTVFIKKGSDSDAFYRRIGAGDQNFQDRVIESYFN